MNTLKDVVQFLIWDYCIIKIELGEDFLYLFPDIMI